MQLLEVDFVQLMNELTKSQEPVGEVMAWADGVCERLMGGGHRPGVHGAEERSTLSSRSILIRWGYVTSQIMRDLVSVLQLQQSPQRANIVVDYSKRSCIWSFPDPQAFP